jgi:hypothetical protein
MFKEYNTEEVTRMYILDDRDPVLFIFDSPKHPVNSE